MTSLQRQMCELCYISHNYGNFTMPFGQEYMRAHRAFRQLSMLLSRRGVHVFRFDYFGTGDSAGASVDGDVPQWIEDIATSIDELKDTAGIERVSLVGLRLGGALAAMAAATRTDIDRLVLWDPVVDGSAYVHELTGQTNGGKADLFAVLGFPLTRHQCETLTVIDLLNLENQIARETLLVTAAEAVEFTQLHKHLETSGVPVRNQCIPTAGNWNEVDNFGGALVPQAIIQAILAWLTEDNTK